ncbi:MAG: sulfatase-like hydrolase/transferase [Acidimicrobiales bacterium]
MANQPNIVFMLADNVGWGDLSCYGNLNPTPRLDRLASEGIRFTNFNTEAQCTPTRSALMTGRMPVRSGTFTVPLGGSAPYGLCPWEYTMAELFSDAGYATGMFGKWHLGKTEDRIPTAQGFDEWWGISESSDEAGWTAHPMYPDFLPRPKIKQAVKGQPYEEVDDFNLDTRPFMDEMITDKTIDFIRRKHTEGGPFYAYVGFTQVHPPVIPHPDFEDATASPHGGPKAMAELDHRAGQILDVIDELGLAKDTIVAWVSDNGSGATAGESFGSGGFWKGCFGGGWEGSYRTPAMIRWPGKIPAGVVTDEMVAALDWFPTLAGLAGLSDKVPEDRPIDGMDMSGFMQGDSDTSGRDLYLYMGVDAEPISAKWKNFKVHFRHTEEYSWTAPYIKRQVPMVMDLINDPHEEIDLMDAELTYAWVIGLASQPLLELAMSAAQFRHIEPGEDFAGY